MVGKNKKDDNWKKFIGNPMQSFMKDFGDTVQAVWMVREFNVKYPKSVQNLRFRFMGAGQVAGGDLQW